MKTAVALMISFVIFGYASVSSAGIVLTEDNGGMPETHLYQDGVYYNIRFGQLESRYDFRRGVCLSANYEQEIYYEGLCDKMIEGSKAAMESFFKERMASMSKEERQMMDQLAKSQSGPEKSEKATVKASGSDTYLDYPVEKFQIIVGSTKLAELWISPKLDKEISKEFDMSRFKAWSDKFADEVSGLQKKYIGFEADDPVIDASKELMEKGFVMKNLSWGANGFVEEEVTVLKKLVKVEKLNVDVSSFVVPKSFKKAKSWQDLMMADMYGQ